MNTIFTLVSVGSFDVYRLLVATGQHLLHYSQLTLIAGLKKLLFFLLQISHVLFPNALQ